LEVSISTHDLKWDDCLMTAADKPGYPLDTNYPLRRGFLSETGHSWYADDSSGDDGQIAIQHRNLSFVSIKGDGSIIVSTNTGSYLYLNAADGEASLIDENGNFIAMDGDGTHIVSAHGTFVDIKKDNVTVSAKEVAITGGCCNLKSGMVAVGDGADAPLVRGTELALWLSTHVHTTPVGPSGPPVTPLPLTLLSVQHKVK
jgi:hypothetical protein